MTEPTRDAQVLDLLKILPTQFGHYGDQLTAAEGDLLAHAAECVKRVPELEAEVRELSDALAEITSLNLSSEKGKGWSADAKMQGASVELWVASLVDLFKAQGGPNYVEASVRDVRDDATYFVIVGPNTAKSPHTIRRELEAEVERLRAVMYDATLSLSNHPCGEAGCVASLDAIHTALRHAAGLGWVVVDEAGNLRYSTRSRAAADLFARRFGWKVTYAAATREGSDGAP